MTEDIFELFQSDFSEMYEVVRTVLVTASESDFRIEVLKRWPDGGYKPRVFKQETVPLPGRNEMILWREYEMGYRATDDPDKALKMALVIVKHQRGR